MRVFLVVAVFSLSALAGCGSDDDGGPPGTGGAGGSNTGTGGAGGSNTGTGGASGSSSGTGGAAGGANVYPTDDAVEACFGQCPKGECDNSGFYADVSCTSVYPSPIDETSSYCGASDGSYCLETAREMFGVQCASGVARVRRCRIGCGGSNMLGFECD